MNDFDEDEEPRNFFAQNKLWLIIGAVAALSAGGYFWKNHKSGSSAPARQERVAVVSLPPPPPPPPKPTPPPVQQPPPDQKIVEKKEMTDDAPKPDVAKQEPAKAPDDPPQSMGSKIEGNDAFGLVGKGSGDFVGIGGNGKGGGGNAFGFYASKVKSGVADALKRDKRTRAETFEVKVKLWIDETGKVTRAEPASGADPIGAAASLIGLRLADRPPAGMPMPLTAHLTGRRP